MFDSPEYDVNTFSKCSLKLYNVGAPWERIALDVTGPFPESDSGNKYFMVVIDYCDPIWYVLEKSRYVVSITKDAKTT